MLFLKLDDASFIFGLDVVRSEASNGVVSLGGPYTTFSELSNSLELFESQ